MYEKILVPLDGSSLAEQVIPYLAELSGTFSSEVIIIEICEPAEKEFGQACQVYIGSRAEILRNMTRDTAVKVKPVVIVGKPATEILNYAEENSVSLIMVTSHGRSGIMPWSLGGTVHKVIHKVGVPLIIVRAEETIAESGKGRLFRRILVPLDGSESSAAVLPYVVELASKFESEIILLRVLEGGRHVHTIGGLDYVPFKDHDMGSMRKEASAYLDKESAKFAGTKATVGCEVRIGDCAPEIIKYAGETDCSLIAMSSHGYSGIEAWLHGSVTHKILQSSDRSVLLVPFLGAHK